MKNITMMNLLASQTLPSNNLAENNLIPEAVIQTFNRLFPNIDGASWEVYGQEYIASFDDDDDNYMEVTFLKDGIWLESATAIHEYDLPEEILEQIEAKYDDFEDYNFIMLIEVPGKSQNTISVSFDTNKENVIMNFNDDGQLLNVESEKL